MEEEQVEREEGTEVPFEVLLRDNRGYQSAFDKKVDKALQTARANWEREQEAALEEHRQSVEQQVRQSLEEETQALARKEADYEHRMRQVEVADQLVGLGLPSRFAGWLTGNTREESMERVGQFETAFREAVRDTVTARMGGPVPLQPKAGAAMDLDTIRGMSPREINAHWAEIQNTLKG